MEVMQEIENLLNSGKSCQEIIQMGYKKATVFSVQKKLRRKNELGKKEDELARRERSVAERERTQQSVQELNEEYSRLSSICRKQREELNALRDFENAGISKDKLIALHTLLWEAGVSGVKFEKDVREYKGIEEALKGEEGKLKKVREEREKEEGIRDTVRKEKEKLETSVDTLITFSIGTFNSEVKRLTDSMIGEANKKAKSVADEILAKGLEEGSQREFWQRLGFILEMLQNMPDEVYRGWLEGKYTFNFHPKEIKSGRGESKG